MAPWHVHAQDVSQILRRVGESHDWTRYVVLAVDGHSAAGVFVAEELPEDGGVCREDAAVDPELDIARD